MIEKEIQGVPVLLFEKFIHYENLFHIISTRHGGISTGAYSSLNLGLDTDDTDANVLHNYQAVSSATGVDLMSLVASRQVHGNRVAPIDRSYKQGTQSALEPVLSGFDSLMTAEPGITLMIRVADCVPMIFFDPDNNAVAVVHGGWRSTLAAIGEVTVQEMKARYKSQPQHILVGIGPSIGPCCFRVQPEVVDAFLQRGTKQTDASLREYDGTMFLNLWEINRQQLLGQGILPEHIEVAGLCTACRSDLFFSHRREQGKTGRFAAFAGLRG